MILTILGATLHYKREKMMTNKVDEIDENEENLEEISSMSGGSVQGYSLQLGAKPKRKKKKNEYYEPELYKEVLNLLIKKGIIQWTLMKKKNLGLL